MIDVLRNRLKEIEEKNQFDGRAYPEGMEPFPKILIGQGFFPGGDGLWRDESGLKKPSPYAFPKDGIMYVGNDFGTREQFDGLKLHENPPTWWRLRSRLLLADVPGTCGFYTNAFLGLRSDRTALAPPIQNKRYSEMCAGFLDFQLSCQQPKLVVVLGPRPASLLAELISIPVAKRGSLQIGRHRDQTIGILLVSHPYSDLGKTSDEKLAEADQLRAAWRAVS